MTESFIYQYFALALFLLIPVFNIYRRAGMNPMLSLLLFVPVYGVIVCGFVLARSPWPVQEGTNSQ